MWSAISTCRSDSLAVPSYLCPLKPASLNNDLVQCLHVDCWICLRLSDLASGTTLCCQLVIATCTVYSTSGMKFSHGLLADICKAAMSWRTEVHTPRFELSVQCTAALCFFSRSPLDCGNRMTSYPWLLVSVGCTFEKVMSTISDSVILFLFCTDSLAFS
jgi:hypothetical protein